MEDEETRLGTLVYKPGEYRLESAFLKYSGKLGQILAILACIAFICFGFIDLFLVDYYGSFQSLLLSAGSFYAFVILSDFSLCDRYAFYEKGFFASDRTSEHNYWFNPMRFLQSTSIWHYDQVTSIKLRFSGEKTPFFLVLGSPSAIVKLSYEKKERVTKGSRFIDGPFLQQVLPHIITGIGIERFIEIVDTNVDDPRSALVDGGYVRSGTT